MVVLRSDLPVELILNVGDDAMVVDAARVSTGLDRIPPMGDADHQAVANRGLINFLMKNRHGSPFEHGSMTFRVEAPIFVAREFMRHRIGWSYNEESGRYKQMRNEFYVPPRDRPLVQVGVPGHYHFERGVEHTHTLTETEFRDAYERAALHYDNLLYDGVAKEVARMVIPVGVYTAFYATCNPRSLMHFLSLRTTDEDSKFPSFPMHEIEVVARGMENEFAELYPVTYEAWGTNGRVAP